MKKQENTVHTNTKKMKRFYYISILFFAIAFLSSCVGIYENGAEMAANAKPTIEEISVDELNIKIEAMDDFFLIDVRQPEEFENGNIPYSTQISRGVLEFKIGDKSFWEAEQWYVPEKDAEIIIYCKKGDRGILATKALNELGYSNVKNLAGGIVAWNPEFDSGSETKEASGCGG